MKTLIEVLNDRAGNYCNKAVLRYRNFPLEYAQILDSSDRFAQGLHNLGYRPGDLIILFMPNIPEYVTAYYGVLKARCRVLPLNASLRKNELKYILGLPDIRGVIYWDRFERKISHLLEQIEKRPKLIRVGEKGELQSQIFENIIAESNPISTDEYPAAEDEAVVLFSCGRTRNPRGAVLTHANLLKSAESIAQAFDYSCDDKIIGVIPFYHYLGNSAIMNAGLISGAEIILHTRFKPEEILQSIYRSGVSIMIGIPSMYQAMVDAPGNENISLSSLRYGIISGGYVSKNLLQRFSERFGVRLIQSYGCIETTSLISRTSENGALSNNLGRPLDNVEVKLIDSKGRSLFPDEIGELMVKSPMNMKKYYNPFGEREECENIEWVFPGELCKWDQDGNLQLTGHKTEVIYKGLFPVNAVAIESLLLEHDAVKDAAVIGINDRNHFQEIKAYVVLNPGKKTTKEDIRYYCLNTLPKYKCPKQIEFVDYLPKNASGMVIKRFLK